MKLWKIIKNIFLIAICMLILAKSALPPADQTEQIRAYTRNIEFDYINWTIDALFTKNQFIALKSDQYLPDDLQLILIDRYFDQVIQIDQLKAQISQIFADPNISEPTQQAAELLQVLHQMEADNKQLGSLAEAVLQQQISKSISDLNLGFGGQLLPPLLYHATSLPMALIVSPRDSIQQVGDISLLPGLTLDEIVMLEKQVEENHNLSALVVNIGGVGIYPTMVMRSTNLSWMIEVVAHEWVHNYLTLHPLGIVYFESPQLRTINETTASLAGKEIALVVYEQFYPQLSPKPTMSPPSPPSTEENVQPIFDFRAEMHETRVAVDEMLAAGKIEEAENYMENRRIIFWENGYQIRKLNQAYFAFYGAYADVPGGVAGADPVGPAVRALREKSSSLASFLKRISWITSFEGLLKAVSEADGS